MKFTRKELDHLWHTSCVSFLARGEPEYLQPINRTWKEIWKKEAQEIFFLHWCESLIDAKTLVSAFKIKYYDIIIDFRHDKTEYVIWCTKDLCNEK